MKTKRKKPPAKNKSHRAALRSARPAVPARHLVPASVSVPAEHKNSDSKVQKSWDVLGEEKLIKLARHDNPDAREALVRSFFPFVASIAKKYKNYFPWIDFNELVEEANFGLLEAVTHFKCKRKVKFTSYAWFWIVKNVQEYIGKQLVFMRVPKKVINNMRKVKKLFEAGIYEKSYVTYEELTKKLVFKIDEVRELLSHHHKMVLPLSLDQSAESDEHHSTLKDFIVSGEESLEKSLEGLERNSALEEVIAKLGEEEASVIKWRFGFIDNKHHSLTEIARRLKLTPQKVRDTELMALARLKMLIADK